MSAPVGRRGLVVGSTCWLVGAACGGSMGCKREDRAPSAPTRCATCGMKVDPASPWAATLVASDGREVRFDTPRCALAAWRRGKVDAASMRVVDYYDRAVRDARTVRFAVGSDVVGPMGPDFVPVDAARAAQFAKDHGATKLYALDEVTSEVLQAAP